MNEKTKLLHNASLEFSVKNANCVCYNAKRITLKNGFSYLLVDKKKAKNINNIAIHSNIRREMFDSGQYDVGDLVIQSPINLINVFREAEDEIDNIYLMKIAGENLYFSVHNIMAYNKEMKQYDYRGELLQNKNKKFIVYDISNVKENLSNNSIPLWLLQKDRLGISIFPYFLTPLNLEKEYLTVEVVDTTALSIPNIDYKENKIKQYKKDKIRLRGINIELEKQQELAFNIQSLSENYNENVFGIMNMINFKSILNDIQKGFGIISNKCQAEFDINYLIETERLYKSEDLIKQVILQLNENELTLFNINEI